MPENYKIITKCKICGSAELTDVISLSAQHLTPTFVKDNSENELANIKVPMTLALCDTSKNPNGCGHLQLREEVEPDLLYRQYFYRSSTSQTMREDLREVVNDVTSRLQLSEGDIVADIGANDCTMISYYPDKYRRVGFEPAKNIDWSGVDKSITIINDYFASAPFKEKFPNEKIKALTCCAMFYDLADPNSFVSQAKEILADDGVWTIQLSYLPLMLENMNFYDICHEHLSYYDLDSLQALMNKNGLRVFDGTMNAVNGGSLRAFVTHIDNHQYDTDSSKANLAKLVKMEEEMKLKSADTYRQFDTQIQDLAKKVQSYIKKHLDGGEKVLGLGASTKGNVLIQLFGIDKGMMPYISERNPDKVGLRTLGTDIELISEEAARDMKPATMVVLPWYFKDEIVKREQDYIQAGGELLFPMPYAHAVTKDGEVRL